MRDILEKEVKRADKKGLIGNQIADGQHRWSHIKTTVHGECVSIIGNKMTRRSRTLTRFLGLMTIWTHRAKQNDSRR